MLNFLENRGQLRQIITKAVCGKGKETIRRIHYIETNKSPDRILGCQIVGHHYEGKIHSDHVEISGHYEVNIWYTYDNNTKTELLRKTIKYTEQVSISDYGGRLCKDEEISMLKGEDPNCLGVSLESSGIRLVIEIKYVLEISGLTRLCVLAFPMVDCDDEKKYDELYNEDLEEGDFSEEEDEGDDDLELDD